jgi:hypothetical protein
MPTMHAKDALVHARKGALLRQDLPIEPRFKPGDRVRTRNINPDGHTRLPRYARDKVGTVVQLQGIYPFPDTNAHGDPRMQQVYLIRFTAQELWGEGAGNKDTNYIDLWEDHLDFSHT